MASWPAGPSQLAGLIRTHDWSGTSLGSIERWPQTLRNVVDRMLAARQPMYIAWGPELASLYNDAYIPILGSKHPNALGMPFEQLWADVAPMESTESVLASEARRSGEAAAIRREREATALLDALLASAPVGLSFMDRDLRFQRINSRLAAMNGLPPEAHLGKRADELLPGVAGLDTLMEGWKRVITSGEPWLGVEVTGETPAAPGEERTWQENFFPVLVGGEVVGVGAVVEEITQRKHAEQALQQREAQLRMLIDNMAGFVAMLDRDGTLLEVGAPALRVAGLKREDVIGRKFWECGWWTHDPVQQARIKQWIAAAAAGATVREDTVARIANDGRLAVDFMLAPVFDEHGNVTHVIPSGVDVSQRKHMERALRENEARLNDAADALQLADRHKDEFLATLAHELRNPLAPLRNGLQIARLISKAGSPLQRTVEMMDRQLTHLVRLVDDLLDVGRISSGKIQLNFAHVALSEVLANSAEASRAIIDSHEHKLLVEAGTEELYVNGDFDRLTQVFSNLLSNAAKYTERSGRIQLRLKREANHAEISVTDNGIGIAEADLQHVFDLFSQVRAHQGHADGGLGIGLSLVRKLIDMHGGTVSVFSAGPGKGSTFTVRLPLLRHDSPAPQRPSSGLVQASGSSRRILVVDDNEDAALSLAMLLEHHGHEVTVAHDGLEAIAKARTVQPDLIFLDLGMPRMDGIEAAKHLRALPDGERLLLVALTGWGQDKDLERTRSAGFDRHLLKPVDPAALSQILTARR
jgi:PAS domain S-box-containing protein